MKFFILALVILGVAITLNDAAGAAADNCQKILCKAPCRVIRNSNNCPVCQCNGPNGNCQFAEKRTGRPKILGERSRRTLERVVKQNRKSSLVEISQEFQSSSGISVSSRTVRRELKNLGFHGRAAAHKPNITPQSAKHRLQWCRAHRHETVDMWKTVLWNDESRFTVWHSDDRLCPLDPVIGNMNSEMYVDILGNAALPTL
ncbi:QLQ domain-containing protein [Trichonephila clavipes]|nr:QLQ domain-containing protein [Trichonephila clavipes]